MVGKFIGHTIKGIFAVFTYLFALFLFVGAINRIMDFYPLDFAEALENMKVIPFKELISIYFKNFFSMVFPIGFLASLTDFPFIFRVFTRGLGDAVSYSLATGEYDLVTSSGEVVGHGDDGVDNAFAHIWASLFLLALFLPLMLFLKPIALIIHLIKWIRLLVAMVRG